jgi:TAZ zinc finger
MTEAAEENAAQSRVDEFAILIRALQHGETCQAEPGKCAAGAQQCTKVKGFSTHVRTCTNDQCQFPYCKDGKPALRHFQSCNDGLCRMCMPVRGITSRQLIHDTLALSLSLDAFLKKRDFLMLRKAVLPAGSPEIAVLTKALAINRIAIIETMQFIKLSVGFVLTALGVKDAAPPSSSSSSSSSSASAESSKRQKTT